MNNLSASTVSALGVFLCFLWSAFLIGWLVQKSHFLADGVQWFRKASLTVRVLAVFSLFGLVALGGGKSGGDRSGGPVRHSQAIRLPQLLEYPNEPSLVPVSIQTDHMLFRPESTNAVEVVAFRQIGGTELGDWIDADTPFFAIGTNPVSRCYVSASGSVSFGAMVRPPIGELLPDETGTPALCPLRAPLGMVPEANQAIAETRSRFWHDTIPDGGKVLTWENILMDRLPGRRVSFQVELQPSGDCVFRYDFQDAFDPLATNFVMGAQIGTNGVNALSILGTNVLAATVWNVNGAPVTNGISLADVLCTNGVLRTPSTFEIHWKNTTGLHPNADTDDDGMTDWEEIFLSGTDPSRADTDGDGITDSVELTTGTDPFNADENGDGIPDGTSEVDWLSNPLWATNTGESAQNITITLNAPIPNGSSASLIVGDLCIPLRTPQSWTLGLIPGELYSYRLETRNGALADLSIAPTEMPLRSNGPQRSVSNDCFPFWLKGTGEIFDEPSSGGSGNMAVPVLHLEWIDPSDGSHENADEVCVHSENGTVYQYGLLPAALNAIPDAIVLTRFVRQGPTVLYLPIESGGGQVVGRINLQDDMLRWGRLFIEKSAHFCEVSVDNPYCPTCGHYMPVDLSLYISQEVLTLKHNNEVMITIAHGEPRGATVTASSIRIRRLGETNWYELASSEVVNPWTARIAGFFELQGKLTVDGQDAYTPIRGLEVQFPSYDEIWADPAFVDLANARWRSILRNTVETNRFEQGFWVKLDTETEAYFHDEVKRGPGVSGNQGAFVELGPRPLDDPVNPSPLAPRTVYTVASFHGHTPTTYRVGGRFIGPSEGDVSADSINQTPGIVYDYVEWRIGTGFIPEGWPKFSPAKLYKTPGLIRRPTPQ